MLYQLYVAGRDGLGLKFKKHRTHTAFVTLHEKGAHAAWQQAVQDNVTVGNPTLPASLKAFLEVMGVLLLALFGLKRWHFVAAAAILLLSQTASESGDDGGGGGSTDDSEESGNPWDNPNDLSKESSEDWDEAGQQRVVDLLNQLQPGLGDQIDAGSRETYLKYQSGSGCTCGETFTDPYCPEHGHLSFDE